MSDVEIFDRLFSGKLASADMQSVNPAAIPPAVLTREELIALLNEDLLLEYTAALQYFQHYARLQGPMYSYIREELQKHGMEEIEHASKLADRITYMGGTPAVGTKSFKLSPNSKTMLEQDLFDEKIAVARYKTRNLQALSLGEFGLASILQEILIQEEEHVSDLETALGPDTVPTPYQSI